MNLLCKVGSLGLLKWEFSLRVANGVLYYEFAVPSMSFRVVQKEFVFRLIMAHAHCEVALQSRRFGAVQQGLRFV
jgi:hypothetical protein